MCLSETSAGVKEDMEEKNADIRSSDGTDTRQTEVKAFRAASSSARLTDENKDEEEQEV